MKKIDSNKLMVVTFLLIWVCTLYNSPSYAGTITDNFNAASLNTRLWQPFQYSQHQRWVQQDGELRIQIDGASAGETFGAGLNSNFLLKGNFEIIVNYRLITWPSANGVSIGFNNDYRFTSGEFVIRRISIPQNESPDLKENYKAAFDAGSIFPQFLVPTTDRSGRLKWTRVGLVMTGYFFNEQIKDWEIIGSLDYSATGLDEWIGFSLNARSHGFAGYDVEIAFDNFQVNYDQIVYPSDLTVYTYTNMPRTYLNDINIFGKIVGASNYSGWIYSNGTYDYLLDAYQPISINDMGQIAGNYNYGSWGFIYDNGTYTRLDYPGAIATSANANNNRGQIVGWYRDVTHQEHGFYYSDGTYTTLDYPGATKTHCYGINDNGQIVGIYVDVNGTHGFIYYDGIYTTMDVPGAHHTTASDINNMGQIVGRYPDVNGTHGFIYYDGTYTTMDVPGALNTYSNGINNIGQIVGYYDHGDGSSHAFLATPLVTSQKPANMSAIILLLLN